jgi:hypothetical protein
LARRIPVLITVSKAIAVGYAKRFSTRTSIEKRAALSQHSRRRTKASSDFPFNVSFESRRVYADDFINFPTRFGKPQTDKCFRLRRRAALNYRRSHFTYFRISLSASFSYSTN